jgi:hypothetical protein
MEKYLEKWTSSKVNQQSFWMTIYQCCGSRLYTKKSLSLLVIIYSINFVSLILKSCTEIVIPMSESKFRFQNRNHNQNSDVEIETELEILIEISTEFRFRCK